MSEFNLDDICMWCAKSYSEHEDSRSESDPVPKVPCLLLKRHFFRAPGGLQDTRSIRDIVIRTVENDPTCLRIVTPISDNTKFSKKLSDSIWKYRDIVGDWPTIEQVCYAIYRYAHTDEAENGE